MVKVCKVPQFSRGLFTHNELSGWADGIAYTPSQLKEHKIEAARKRREKRLSEVVSIPPVPVERLEIGFSL